MATNQDFNNLIGRIGVATDTLETNVGVIVQTGVSVSEQLILAQTAAANAAQEATNATTQATDANAKATIATTQAIKAEQQAQIATQAKSEALTAVTEAKALAPFQEAPKNGSVYGRKDGTWALVESSGGGVGTVVSVNGISPDIQGNVTLTIPEQVNSDWNAISGKAQILNKPTLFSGNYADLTGKPILFSGAYADLTGKPTLFSGSYTDLTNKPTIPTNTNQLTNGSGFITDAPVDAKQYARSGATWVEVAASGGGGTAKGYPIGVTGLYYNLQPMSEWQSLNPNQPIDLSKLAAYVNGEFYEGVDFFLYDDGIDELPTGRFFYKLGNLTAPMNNSYGYIEVVRVPLGNASPDKVVATAYGINADGMINIISQYKPTTKTWVQQWKAV